MPLGINDRKEAMEKCEKNIMDNFEGYVDFLVSRGCVSPKVILIGDPDALKNEISIKSFDRDEVTRLDRISIFNRLNEIMGIGRQAREAVRPFSKAKPSVESSTA